MLEPQTCRHIERKLESFVKLACTDSTSEGLPSTADPEAFAEILGMLEHAVKVLMPQAAQDLMERDGYSYADMARPVGVTKSAFYQRFGRKIGSTKS